MENNVEHEICNNCKKEIPQYNYLMHTTHCTRNITLCKTCKEPVPKGEFGEHEKSCKKPTVATKPFVPLSTLEKSSYFQARKAVEDKKAEVRKERYMQKMDRLVDSGYSLKERNDQNTVGRTSYNTGNRYEFNKIKEQDYAKSYRNLGKKDTFSNVRAEKKIATVPAHVASVAVSTSSVPFNSATARLNTAPGHVNTGPVPLQAANVPVKTSVPSSFPVASPVKKSEAKPSGMLACKFCDLELPKLELEDHENYCGTRTDKCLECGELVMFKYKQMHMDSNHGFLKLKDEPGPRPSWDSSTERSASSLDSPTRRRPQSFRPPLTDFDYDPMPYLPSSYQVPGGGAKKKEGESYKEISRRLDCKTEYIRNLLHDSAGITVPLRRSGAVPRNHFNHNKGPAPQPPSYRRRNPPTEIVIPCEFCDVPVPHEDLIEHETGCRPDLARFNPRRKSLESDDYFIAPQPSSPEEDLPCEFCGDMIPASQLLGHQIRCT